MKLLLKSSLVFLAWVIGQLVWKQRQRASAARLAEIERGARCLGCDGTDMWSANGRIGCQRCGYEASRQALAAGTLSHEDIANITRPDSDSKW